jgi:Subtilase family
MKHWHRVVTAVLPLVVAAGITQAQTSKTPAKIPWNLIALSHQYSQHLAQRSALPFTSADPLIALVDDRVVIDAVASDDVNVLKSDLEFLGMQGAVAFGRVVSGQLPISSITAAEALISLRFAQTAKAVTNAGGVISQGDLSMRADVARATFGLDGSGIKVGVLSDSYNCLGGAAMDIANGDLSQVTVVQEISSCTGATDEGRAMLQIVHDVAPGASLGFASAFNGMASFAANITALKNNGAKVIVDDVMYLTEPMFQDGIIAQTVDRVVSNGVAYFSSAGNQARQSYQSVFRPGDTFAPGAFASAPGAAAFLGGTAHNFNSSGGKDQFLSVTIPAGTSVTIILQWDSRFFSVSGSPGTQNDLDLYVFDASATQVLNGTTFNNIGGDAVELFGSANTASGPLNVSLMIVKHSGADPGLLKFVYFFSGAPPTINEFNTQSGTIYGHANAAGAEAVGAARYSKTPAFGISPPVLESFSSSGATLILFDVAGNRLVAPDARAYKPEIVAPDGADTTFFGSFDFDGTGFPNFFGTSAAAPHAAGVAALLIEAKPATTPAQIYTALESTAVNMDVAGYDNNSGFGLIQAHAALASILSVARVEFNGGANVIITGGDEISGLSRGPAVQVFNKSGALLATRFALNTGIRTDLNFLLGNFDPDPGDEMLVGGRETRGLVRGPVYQLFDVDGSFAFTNFVLNSNFTDVSFSPLNVVSNGVVVCGRETTGLARGPAYQAFNSSGNLVRTQFALNTDFSMDNSCLGTNLDGVAGDEVIMAGREVTGAARGPAIQTFNNNGSLKFTQFVLNPNFIETKVAVANPGSNAIITYGRENSGASRGPAFQTFNDIGSLVLTRFVLNRDFTDIYIFGANTTNSVAGGEIVTGGTETSGLVRGPAIQVWDKNGNHLFTRFVLNSDFTEVKFSKIDINNDGVDEILVVGRENKGLARGPAIQLFDGGGNHLFTKFVLNSDFTNLKFFPVDVNGDSDQEIGVGGIETSGLARGPAYQIFESDGTLLETVFVLNADF